jgi:ribonuclease J
MPEPLRIVPLGGLGEVGKNMMVYEHGGDAVVGEAGGGVPRPQHHRGGL